MLDLRYDSRARHGYVKLRPGRTVRSRPLSSQAVAEYNGRGELVAIAVSELDPTSAEFLRTADEETLLQVIAAQAGRSKAGVRPRADAAPPAAKPKSRPRPKPAAAGDEPSTPAPKPARRRRRRARRTAPPAD